MKFLYSVVLLLCYCTIFSQSLIISEVCPSNTFSYTDSEGNNPDWIELHNTSQTSINLSEYSIARTSNKHTPHPLPNHTLLANRYIVLGYKELQYPTVTQWHTHIDLGDEWKYHIPNQELPSNWTHTDFNDNTWLTGTTPIGYGNNGVFGTTIPPSTSLYIRKTFTLEQVDAIAALLFHMDYDDGFVAYINGQEVARAGLSGYPPTYDQLSTGHEANWYRGLPIDLFEISNLISLLQAGENCLAVQIHNTTTHSSDLSAIPILTIGYRLSNSISNPATSSHVILPHQNTGLTFPFNLSAREETVYLFRNNILIDSISFENVPTDVSIGRHQGIIGTNYYFSNPTPGSANTGDRFTARTLDPPFISKPSGEYVLHFNVGLFSTENNVEIRYTLDGSDPTIFSDRYIPGDSIAIRAPQIVIDDPDHIPTRPQTQIKARVFRNGFLPSAVSTSTYINHPRPRSIPIISIVVNHDDFFDWHTGIYVEGPNASHDAPRYGANYWEDWEKPAHIAIIEPDGTLSLSMDLGVKIAGNWSRMNPQKSLKFYSRARYGYREIQYQMFKDKPIYEFQSFQLRNAGNDFLNSHMRDGLTSALVRNTGIARSAYQPAIVYINGEYYGVQNFREKINKHYYLSNFGIPHNELNYFATSPWDTREGSGESYNQLLDFVSNNDISVQANYEIVAQQLDIDYFITYYIIQMFVVNEDWPGNNILFWKGSALDDTWRMVLYDTDFGFGTWDDSKVYRNMLDFVLSNDPNIFWPNPPWSTLMFRKLYENLEFKHKLMNYTADRLNTTFLPDSVNPLIDSLFNLVSPEFEAMIQKFEPDHIFWRVQHMNGQREYMQNFVTQRISIMRNHFEQHFNTNGSYQLTLSMSNNSAGKITLNSIDVTKFPWSGLYFRDIPITLTAKAAPGYTFVRWEGDIHSTEQTITVTRNSATSIHAVFEIDSYNPLNVFFTELQYNPKDEFSGGNWIELYNNNNYPVDISGWHVFGNPEFKQYTILENTIIPPFSYLVICSDTTSFKLANPDVTIQYTGNIPFTFSNRRDIIRLTTPEGFEIDKLAYFDRNPWPKKADGYGYTLELTFIGADRTVSRNWRAASYGGTPGKPNNPVILTPHRHSIIINEINYSSHSNYRSGDWFELYNKSNFDIDISGWVIKDDNDNRIFIVPEGTLIYAQDYAVFADNPIRFSAIFPTVDFITCPISLGSYSDMVRLYDQYELLIDSVHYSIFPPWPMLANGFGYTLALTSPDVDNSIPQNWMAGAIPGSPGEANFGSPPTTVFSIPKYSDIALAVFPNPATSFIKHTYHHPVSIVIYSMIGRIVYSGTDTIIDVSLLPRGVYTCVITQDSKQYTHTIILQ